MLEFVGNKGCHKYIYVMNNHLNWGSFIEGKVHNNSNNGSDEVKVKAIVITNKLRVFKILKTILQSSVDG